jgi:hypothetical protein
MRKALVFFLILIAFVLIAHFARTETYSPTDSLALTIGTTDTTFLTVATPDSVWFKWWRDIDGQTIVDSAKVTTALRTGFIRHKIKASDASNNAGTYIAEAVAYKDGKTGIKTWSWMVKTDPNEAKRGVKRIFVNSSGNNSNDGLSWETAKATINGANAILTGADLYEIYVGAGSWSNVCCSLTVDRTKLIGMGREFTTLNGKASEDHIITVTADGVSISGFKLIGEISGEYGDQCGIRLEDADGFYISDIAFQKCDKSIEIYPSSSWGRLDNLYMFDSNWDGIKCHGQNILVTNVFIDSLRYSGADGIVMMNLYPNQDSSKNNIIVNSYVRTTMGNSFREGTEDYRPHQISWLNNYSQNPDTSKIFAIAGYYPTLIGNKEPSKIVANNTEQEDIYYVFVNKDSVIKTNIVQIDSSFPSAYNLKRMTDGDTTTLAKLTLSQLFIRAGSVPGIDVRSLYNYGIFVSADSGVGKHTVFFTTGSSNAGSGLYITNKIGSTADAVYVKGQTAYAIRLEAGESGIFIKPGEGWAGIDLSECGGAPGIWGTISSDGSNDIQSILDSLKFDLSNMANFWGVADADSVINYPADGSANKDSTCVFSGGAKKKTIKYRHSNVPSIIDGYDIRSW